jgi:hypothetical protein
MLASSLTSNPSAAALSARYAKCIEASKRIRWDIDRDVIRGRRFDTDKTFLPHGLSKVGELGFLAPAEARFLSQVHRLGDQVALEALVRLTDEEIKHQILFRRLDEMAAAQMPPGYRFVPPPNDVAEAVLGKSTWAVLALTLDIELFSLAHYRSSIEPEAELCPLWKDVFLFHWKEESQHAILDELEWRREHARLSEAKREQGVDDLIALVGAVDGVVQMQAEADADYFLRHAGRDQGWLPSESAAVRDLLLRAYRWQYIVTGVQEPRFAEVMKALVTPAQMERIGAALAPIFAHAGH